ncbi:bifunctional DNA-formamidopyrimidine glycosylase/DNA-(apurinic or apyrimidinic site) lyase [Thiomonas sp.]|uniref:bifunctional DNA-formamidopyrimidine glycosylase/DNA-(apurinic or apyrimidinic site) lyase n=1 Tax=Thiomonas sp. TaxID=2047785 RepID=UPI002589AEB8|nr:bifunctional DNA-formamidopyrimidine glycosylase/DNA-(apurinic or apyrimidinic site) lyase [Thiomonas sp.]
MPELPEVEVTRLGLADALRGARITALHQGKPLRWPLGCTAQELAGQRIERLDRRGKYLLLKLPAGDLIVHLGMSGSLRWIAAGDDASAPGAHEHFVLQTDRGQLRLRDPRRFGAVIWHPTGSPPHALLARLGPEPLGAEFDAAQFHRRLHGRHAAIKPLLLDQSIVAGIGNIYACEALFRAAIHPETPAGSLSPRRCSRLAAEIRATLADAVAAGGSSLRDFAHADGELGHFQLDTRVYGRVGQPCRVCSTPVVQITQGQRSTYFCPRCQRR